MSGLMFFCFKVSGQTASSFNPRPERSPAAVYRMTRKVMSVTNRPKNQCAINRDRDPPSQPNNRAASELFPRRREARLLTQRITSRVVLLILVWAGLSSRVWAQSSSDQFWPKIEGHYSFNPQLRLGVMASRSTDGASYNSIEVGPTLNFFAKRFVRPVLTTPDEAKNSLLVFGVGYRYLAGINQAPENRIELDFTPQFHLPLGMQAADRNRVDLRFIEGSAFSWRYRNRVNLQRTFNVRRFAFSPYAQGEFFYSSSSGSWNKTTFQVGSDFLFRKHFDLEPYFEHDNNVGSVPNQVNAFGLTIYIYF